MLELGDVGDVGDVGVAGIEADDESMEELASDDEDDELSWLLNRDEAVAEMAFGMAGQLFSSRLGLV